MARPKTVAISGDITFETVSSIREQFPTAERAVALRVTLPDDARIDIAGLQLIAALVADQKARGKALELQGDNLLARFDAMATFCGLPVTWRTT